MIVPVMIASRFKVFKGLVDGELDDEKSKSKYSGVMLYLGLGAILFVPIFKTITHLPPYVGMMLSLGVAAMESLGILFNAAGALNEAIPNTDIVVLLFGLGSAVIDNVPLVAASMGMFSEPLDSPLWHFIAYSAGTGGSMLIIGSAAGVVAMGMEKIDFFWYLKKIAWLAFAGFISGAVVFILLRDFVLNV